MISWRRRYYVLASSLFAAAALLGAENPPTTFFEPDQPFFQTQVQVAAAATLGEPDPNFVVRGIVLPVEGSFAVVFDQELLRVAAVWSVPVGQPPVTPTTMAQISYMNPRRKVGGEHPQPTGPVLLSTRMHPGVARELPELLTDLRPAGRLGDAGRGPLPADVARFEGIETAGAKAILRYRSGETAIREWFEGQHASEGAQATLLRHLEIGAHSAPLHFRIGAAAEASWNVNGTRNASTSGTALGSVTFATNSDAVTVTLLEGELVATVSPSDVPQRLSLALIFGPDASAAETPVDVRPTPALPASKPAELRWPESATSSTELASLSQNGLIFDRIAVPENNPWQRRVRSADIAFFDADHGAVVTYDGDVWLVNGLAAPDLPSLTWRRFASGLSEPLTIANVAGTLQVATKHGIVRLHDRDRNGEADWYENFSDQLLQSQTTRSFPLDMAIAPDGSTYVTQGGIVNLGTSNWGGTGTAHSGGIVRIAPDGRTAELVGRAAREPFVAVHPKSGVVTATDQQGNYIPSSVSYLVRPGASFGYLEDKPDKLTPPLVWIPHDQDTSSTSEAWMMGEGMGAWNGRLIHLSYGTGRLFIISPDLDAPTPQAAAIPLDLKTDFPLLHARMHPAGDALYLAGFQIWGTRTKTAWGLARLRPGPTPIVTAVAARSMSDGVILNFASPLDPASLQLAKVSARGWNYFRSSAYGSGRYPLGAELAATAPAGTTGLGIAQLVLSTDRRSVFVHLPHLPPAMELEVRHDLFLADGTPCRGTVYFTIHEPRTADLAAAGFPEVDLTKQAAAVVQEAQEAPTAEMGRALAENLGCAACHSIDGTTEGKVGPTWKWLYRTNRRMADGSVELADEFYLREKILDPMKRRVTTGPAEMPSYRGVVSENQLDALVLYIKSLAQPKFLKGASPDDVPPDPVAPSTP